MGAHCPVRTSQLGKCILKVWDVYSPGGGETSSLPPCKPRLDCPRGSRELGVTSQPPTLGLQGRMRVDPASEKQTRAWASTPLQRSREGVNRWGKGETGWTAAPSSAGARVRRRGTP